MKSHAKIEGIDHVALAVRDVGRSVAWYQQVLELERIHEDVWGDFPAIVGIGTTSLALFPIQNENPKPRPERTLWRYVMSLFGQAAMASRPRRLV